jgi:hypothetical protein
MRSVKWIYWLKLLAFPLNDQKNTHTKTNGEENHVSKQILIILNKGDKQNKFGCYVQAKLQPYYTSRKIKTVQGFTKEGNTNLPATWMQSLPKEYYFLKMCLKSLFLERSLKALKQLSGAALVFTRRVHGVIVQELKSFVHLHAPY